MSVPEALLDAGAVLPSGAGVAHDTIDTLTTRAYRHPVLGERTVVRLVPGTLGPAEDLTMEFLGFAAPETVTEVGVVRQQALGFPAWALVHDPANGHHALALVKDIERLVRIAKSRIGPARDGFVELGDRLARSVPHFLPTFYEEAARAFLAADSPTYAASMFGKARDAERAFALKIDEDRQHTVFLEFALAGALTAKALSAYARDLAARADAATAYERFRRLCVERTLGGMPPYASMHTDLRRLAKAAKLGQDEEEALLRVLLTATSIVRAPGGFWTAYRAVLVSVAGQDPAVRGQLLTMFPGNCPDETWLEILEESGATAALTGPAGAGPAEAESPDGPAGWLTRLHQHRSGWRRERLAAEAALVTRMAPRLRADGVPADLCSSSGYVDLDVVDLCLELEVPLGEVAANATCPVEQWLKDDKPGRRDLVHVAAHPRLLPRVAHSIEDHLRPGWRSTKVSPEEVAAVVAVPGLRTALHWWIDRLADSVIEQGLPGIDDQLKRLALIACPEGLAVNPEAVRRITGHDLGPVLAATLRAGVFDEYGWPALETAVDALVGGADIESDDDSYDAKVRLQRQWPQLVVRAGDQVAVVGGDGVELEHTLRIPADQRRYDWSTVLRYVDGQLLVSWDIGEERAGYWSGTADDVFTTPDESFGTTAYLSMALPGGGRTAGGRPLHVGDRSAQERSGVCSDGKHYWALAQTADQDWHWHELDVATGTFGRPSLPAFFEAGAVDGQSLEHSRCRLMPAPPQTVDSPLGHRDGLLGWRVRTTAADTQVGTGIDGRTFTMPEKFEHGRRHGRLVGAIRFPGSDTVYGMVYQEAWRDNRIILCTEDGAEIATLKTNLKQDPFREGTRMMPPPTYWHYLRARDEAGSAALRAVTDDQAARLLAAVVDLVGPDAKIDGDTARKLVGETFPEVGAAPLVAGIAGVVKQAARSVARLVELTSTTEAIAAQTEQADPDGHLPDDRTLNAALSGLIPSCYNYEHVGANLYIHVGAALLGREPQRPIVPIVGSADPDWFDVVGALPAVLYRAVAPLISTEQHTHLLGLLDVIAGSGLLAPGGRLRRLWLQADDLTAMPKLGDIIATGERRLVVVRTDPSDGEVKAIEYSPDGTFGAVPGHAITQHHVLDPGGWDAARLAAFVATARERGPLPWRPELVPAVSAAAGITLADATVLLADPVSVKDWEERRPDGWDLGGVLTDAAIEGALSDRDSLPHSERRSLGLALLPDDPADLWTTGPAVERTGAWHVERYGARTPLADDLIVEVRKAGIASGIRPSAFAHGLANPETCRWLHGPVEGIGVPDLLRGVTRAVPWLVRRLPAGHALRVSLPRVLDLVRQRLADPDLELQIGTLYEDDLTEFVAKLGLPVTVDGTTQDAGLYKIVHDRHWPEIMLRPARLAGPDDPRLAALLTELDSSPRFIVAMRAILRGQLDTWVEAAGSPEGADEDHDPSRSAPDLVADVAARHGIGADAATLYLQLLALPDPTDRNVAAWTGWKPARLKKARAELAATDLVVEAKRPRAGRSLFLPGGWVALASPNLPFELWKLPLFIRDGDNVISLGAVIPVAPAPALFTVAWARVTGGDHPRFEELTTRGRR